MTKQVIVFLLQQFPPPSLGRTGMQSTKLVLNQTQTLLPMLSHIWPYATASAGTREPTLHCAQTKLLFLLQLQNLYLRAGSWPDYWCRQKTTKLGQRCLASTHKLGPIQLDMKGFVELLHIILWLKPTVVKREMPLALWRELQTALVWEWMVLLPLMGEFFKLILCRHAPTRFTVLLKMKSSFR